MCEDTRIAAGNVIGTNTGLLSRYVSDSFASISADVVCTDYSSSVGLDYSSVERVNIMTLPLNQQFVIDFFDGLDDRRRIATKSAKMNPRPDQRELPAAFSTSSQCSEIFGAFSLRPPMFVQ